MEAISCLVYPCGWLRIQSSGPLQLVLGCRLVVDVLGHISVQIFILSAKTNTHLWMLRGDLSSADVTDGAPGIVFPRLNVRPSTQQSKDLQLIQSKQPQLTFRGNWRPAQPSNPTAIGRGCFRAMGQVRPSVRPCSNMVKRTMSKKRKQFKCYFSEVIECFYNFISY